MVAVHYRFDVLAGTSSVVDVWVLELFVVVRLSSSAALSLPRALTTLVLLAGIALVHSVGKLGGR